MQKNFPPITQGALSEVGLNRVEDLQEAVDRLSASIQRAKAKILGQEPAPIEQEVGYHAFHICIYCMLLKSYFSFLETDCFSVSSFFLSILE